MEVTFKLDEEDIVHLGKWQQASGGCAPWMLGLVMFSLAIGTLLVSFLNDRRLRLRWMLLGPAEFFRQQAPALLSMFLPVCFFVAFWFFILKSSVRSNAKQLLATPGFANRQTVRLTPAGLFAWTMTSETLFRWLYLLQIAEDATHIFVQVDKASVIVIPKRAFADEAAAQQFFETAEKYWREAKGTPPPIPHPGGQEEIP